MKSLSFIAVLFLLVSIVFLGDLSLSQKKKVNIQAGGITCDSDRNGTLDGEYETVPSQTQVQLPNCTPNQKNLENACAASRDTGRYGNTGGQIKGCGTSSFARSYCSSDYYNAPYCIYSGSYNSCNADQCDKNSLCTFSGTYRTETRTKYEVKCIRKETRQAISSSPTTTTPPSCPSGQVTQATCLAVTGCTFSKQGGKSTGICYRSTPTTKTGATSTNQQSGPVIQIDASNSCANFQQGNRRDLCTSENGCQLLPNGPSKFFCKDACNQVNENINRLSQQLSYLDINQFKQMFSLYASQCQAISGCVFLANPLHLDSSNQLSNEDLQQISGQQNINNLNQNNFDPNGTYSITMLQMMQYNAAIPQNMCKRVTNLVNIGIISQLNQQGFGYVTSTGSGGYTTPLNCNTYNNYFKGDCDRATNKSRNGRQLCYGWVDTTSGGVCRNSGQVVSNTTAGQAINTNTPSSSTSNITAPPPPSSTPPPPACTGNNC